MVTGKSRLANSVRMHHGADWIVPDFVDSGQRMHHYHLLFGYSHDVRSEDELAETLRKKRGREEQSQSCFIVIQAGLHTMFTTM